MKTKEINAAFGNERDLRADETGQQVRKRKKTGLPLEKKKEKILYKLGRRRRKGK